MTVLTTDPQPATELSGGLCASWCVSDTRGKALVETPALSTLNSVHISPKTLRKGLRFPNIIVDVFTSFLVFHNVF